MRDEWGNTLLHIAAMAGHSSLIKQMCMLGARVNETNHNKQTPLFLASYHSEINAILTLSGIKTINVIIICNNLILLIIKDWGQQ